MGTQLDEVGRREIDLADLLDAGLGRAKRRHFGPLQPECADAVVTRAVEDSSAERPTAEQRAHDRVGYRLRLRDFDVVIGDVRLLATDADDERTIDQGGDRTAVGELDRELRGLDPAREVVGDIRIMIRPGETSMR